MFDTRKFPAVIKNYLKIAFRNLVRHKGFSTINILGLATGMACSIIILLWVTDELSYDKFHKNAATIYRSTVQVNEVSACVTPAPFAPYLEKNLKGIANITRTSAYTTHILESGERKFEEKSILYADPAFMKMFSFPIKKGDGTLNNPDGIVITERMAVKYFGNDDAIGKTIKKDNKESLTVVGILENVPTNSHLQFDFLIPMAFAARTDFNLRDNVWGNFNFFTYVQTAKVQTPASLKAMNASINKLFESQFKDFKADFSLQPLTDIHLHSKFMGDVTGHGSAQYVTIFSIIAIFILIVACINFMNLATARSARRSKEVGLRKAIGANRQQLIWQFLGEATFISLTSLIVAFVIVALVLPSFNTLAEKNISLNFFDWKIVLGMIGIALVTGLVSGSYPALFLSSFQPVKVLKGRGSNSGGNVFFRNALVVTQFVISIALIIGTVVVLNQMHFIRNKNLGYDKENLLCMPLTGELASNQKLLKETLLNNPLTSNAAIVTELPINFNGATLSFEWEGKDPNFKPIFYQMGVDEKFMNVFKTQLISGRNFSKDLQTDSSNFILNEKAVTMMGLNPKTALGKRFVLWGATGNVVGVVKDFNFKGMHSAIDPMILRVSYGEWVVVKAQAGKAEATIKALEKINAQLNPYYPFSFRFLDETLNNQYKGEQRMGSLFNIFAVVAIFISCLGLYGLSAFMAEQKNKEIGVRKVLGANFGNIIYLLSRNFTMLLFVAMLIAVPLSIYAMNTWLNGFAYRTNISWWIPVAACICALVVAGITVSYESIKAAMANPVKSLRSE